MTTKDKIVAVIGATGQQGGAVAKRLLAEGWRVRAISRDPAKPAARALAAAGAEVVAADMDDRASLDAAFAGAWGVYSVHTGAFDGTEYADDPEHEVRSGVNVADAAKVAGASHLVYSSSTGVDNPEMVGVLPILAHKKAVEAHIRSLGISYTILRPTSFMENYLGAIRGLRDGALVTPLAPTMAEPLIAVADIAAFVALAFADPKAHDGLVHELAGDQLTQTDIAAALGRTAGREVPYVQVPIEQLRAISEALAEGLDMMNRVAMNVDIEGLRKWHPGLLDFEAWLAANRDAITAKVTQAETTGR
ncbi:NmrA/HSCARG family protein [Stackebrandtia nassauensis]|uniref:NmrA family protein n=1 Tax=Stackebrandtia nassauensis (strain DSM 44728 / CIP 108903 / NRRL B-16338 / NBRC 102104 / LLR-40K-21) TaxID=446470 RepID=D3PYW0_STANL|nr:NmrA/HSCARG family protein [Stackebrandtia nassauensis]ADD43543.1 NmrA family protein [Stackebrandtia nassauensis DSM 44728]